MKHEIKIYPPEFARIKLGIKTFVICDNDDDIQYGDTVELMEFDNSPVNATDSAPKGFTDSPRLTFKVGFIQSRGHSQVIISLLNFDDTPKKK